MVETISAIMSVLLTIRSQSQERILINELNSYHKFDHNIFLLDVSVDRNQFFDWSSHTADRLEFTPQSLHVFKSFSNPTTSVLRTTIRSKNTFVIVAPGGGNYLENLKLLTHVKELQLLDVNMKIGLFFSDTIPINQTEKHLEWCWKHSIVNVFIIHRSINNRPHSPVAPHPFDIFRLNIFETFEVMNVTGSGLKNVFPPLVLNFQQHPLRVLDTKIPSDLNVWRVVLRVLNASLVVISPEKLINTTTRSDIFETGMDVIQGLEFYRDYPGIQFLYPMSILSAVMVVPEALPYPKFTTYLLAVTNNEFFVTSSMTIIVTVSVLSCCRYINQRKIRIVKSAIDVLNILLVNDNGHIEYRRLSLAEVFVIVPVTFAGFFMLNFILSTFQSHLTRPYNHPEIDTFEDLYRSPYVVMTNSEEMRIHTISWLNNVSQHEEWNNRVHSMDYKEFFLQIFAYNTSMSFPLEFGRAKHLIKRQHQLKVRGYRAPSEMYLRKIFASYAIWYDYPFVERLNGIIHRLQSAGLYNKWWDEDLQLWLKQISLEKNNSKDGSEKTSFGQLQALELITYGWIAACAVFVVEVLWEKIGVWKII